MSESLSSVVAEYRQPETASELSRTLRLLLADRLDIAGLGLANVETSEDGDVEAFEVALDSEGEYAVVVAPLGVWYAWRKQIQRK